MAQSRFDELVAFLPSPDADNHRQPRLFWPELLARPTAIPVGTIEAQRVGHASFAPPAQSGRTVLVAKRPRSPPG